MTRIVFKVVCLFWAVTVQALPPKPAPEQSQAVAITNVTIHIGDGEVIEQGTVTFDQGLITGVYSASETPDIKGHQIVDPAGQHLYPGLILPDTRLGLVEVNNVRGTRDDQEGGLLNPSVRSLVSYNTDSELIPTLRFNGVLTAQIAPRGGLVSGVSSVVQLDAWNWQDASLLEDDAMHVHWPSHIKAKPDYLRQVLTYEKNDQYADQVRSLAEMFAAAKHETLKNNLKLNSVRKVLAGEAQLFLHVDTARQIVDAIAFAETENVPRVVLVGADEALKVKELILEKNIPIIVQFVLGLPTTIDGPVDEAYRRPAEFIAAGFDIGLGTRVRQEPASDRNLPFMAGTAVAYGLEKEQALALMTSQNARILGLDRQLGTITVGKRATLFVSVGDALDMRSNQLTATFIDGRSVEIRGMQQELYERFHSKYAK